ncbi:MAG: hypothetical protein U0997_08090 [Sulfurimicrobium sp.]|nr:hypothetical protein [Sulfurimicrobium sp.]
MTHKTTDGRICAHGRQRGLDRDACADARHEILDLLGGSADFLHRQQIMAGLKKKSSLLNKYRLNLSHVHH